MQLRARYLELEPRLPVSQLVIPAVLTALIVAVIGDLRVL